MKRQYERDMSITFVRSGYIDENESGGCEWKKI